MIFEGSHVAQHAFVHEKRSAPLHCLLDLRASSMDQFANVLQDGFGKIGGPADIVIDPRVICSHNIFVGAGSFFQVASPVVSKLARIQK
jgi:hypothetical protein